MTNESRLAYSEVVEILTKMDAKYVEKVPLKLREYLTYNKLPNYVQHINMEQPLKEQQLSKKTISLLAMLNLKYWTKTKEHKEELIKLYNDNETKYQEKYSYNNIFKKKDEVKIEEKEELQLVVIKENIIQRIFNKIKKWLKIQK